MNKHLLLTKIEFLTEQVRDLAADFDAGEPIHWGEVRSIFRLRATLPSTHRWVVEFDLWAFEKTNGSNREDGISWFEEFENDFTRDESVPQFYWADF